MNFIVLADVETVLNVRDVGMLPRLAALGADIVIARPLYNRLRLGSVADLIDRFTPPITLIGTDERNWRRCWQMVPVVVSVFMLGAGRKRMERGGACSCRKAMIGIRRGGWEISARCSSTNTSM